MNDAIDIGSPQLPVTESALDDWIDLGYRVMLSQDMDRFVGIHRARDARRAWLAGSSVADARFERPHADPPPGSDLLTWAAHLDERERLGGRHSIGQSDRSERSGGMDPGDPTEPETVDDASAGIDDGVVFDPGAADRFCEAERVRHGDGGGNFPGYSVGCTFGTFKWHGYGDQNLRPSDNPFRPLPSAPDWEVFVGTPFGERRPPGVCWQRLGEDSTAPPDCDVCSLDEIASLSVPDPYLVAVDWRINAPLVEQFNPVCGHGPYHLQNDDDQFTFVKWVMRAWGVLFESNDLVDAAMCMHKHFTRDRVRRGKVLAIIRGNDSAVMPFGDREVRYAALAGRRTRRTEYGCARSRDLYIGADCSPGGDQTAWSVPDVLGEPRYAIYLRFTQNDSGVDNAYATYKRAVEAGNTPRMTASVIWLAGVLFHELLHIVGFSNRDPDTGQPGPFHRAGNCDQIFIAENTLHQLLMRRYTAAQESNIVRVRSTGPEGLNAPLFSDDPEAESYTSGTWTPPSYRR